jgi:hypothetical protein
MIYTSNLVRISSGAPFFPMDFIGVLADHQPCEGARERRDARYLSITPWIV